MLSFDATEGFQSPTDSP